MAKEVIRTNAFLRQLTKFDKSYLERIEKLVIKIIQNPKIGKPMMYGRKGTREVYLPPFRLYYAFDEEKARGFCYSQTLKTFKTFYWYE